MTFTARIPKYVVFSNKNKSQHPRTNWGDLPIHSDFQEDTKGLHENAVVGSYWAEDSSNQVASLKESKQFYVFDNSRPTKLTLVGWGCEGISVALESGHVVELPLDVLFNTIRTEGLKPDNKTLKGEFIFSMTNRRLFPVQVNSGLHKAILEKIERKKKKKIEVKDLIVGNMYRTSADNVAVFLGYVNTETIVVDKPKNPISIRSHQFSPNNPVKDFNVRFLKKKLATLWYESWQLSWDGHRRKPEDVLTEIQDNLKNGYIYKFKCKKSHRYTEKVKDFYVDLPTNIVMQTRAQFEKVASEKIMVGRQRRTINSSFHYNKISPSTKPDKIRFYDAITAKDYAAECNMTLVGLDIIRSNTFKQFEPWEKKKNSKASKVK